ncbi:hypothetical protein ACRAWD_30860 [Caulobacter segnis]
MASVTYDLTDKVKLTAELRRSRMWNNYIWFGDHNRGNLDDQGRQRLPAGCGEERPGGGRSRPASRWVASTPRPIRRSTSSASRPRARWPWTARSATAGAGAPIIATAKTRTISTRLGSS